MHSFVVRIALRQHVPLRAGVQNPKHRFKNQTCRNRLTARTAPFPFQNQAVDHPPFIADKDPTLNFDLRMGWTGRVPALSGRASKHEGALGITPNDWFMNVGLIECAAS